MFTTDVHVMLALSDERSARLRAAAAEHRLARAVRASRPARRPTWLARLTAGRGHAPRGAAASPAGHGTAGCGAPALS